MAASAEGPIAMEVDSAAGKPQAVNGAATEQVRFRDACPVCNMQRCHSVLCRCGLCLKPNHVSVCCRMEGSMKRPSQNLLLLKL